MVAPVAICLSKTTTLVMLFQIFHVRKAMRLAIWAGIVANIVVYFPTLIVAPILGAPHIGETWEDLILYQRLASLKWIGAYQGPCAVLLDIYIFVLPFPVLHTLNMPSKKRLKLSIIFGTGLLGIVSGVVACVYRFRLIVASTDDGTWAEAQILIPLMLFYSTVTDQSPSSSVVDIYVALIVGCMPAFAGFLSLHVAGSAIYKLLRTQLMGKASNKSSTDNLGAPGWMEGIETVGGGGGKKGKRREVHQTTTTDSITERAGYYQLQDTSLFHQNQALVESAAAPSSGGQGHPGAGITRTLDVNQRYDKPTVV